MNKRLPLGLLAILMILMLAGVGVAYGLWAETLTIAGWVTTGNVDVAFETATPTEDVWVQGTGWVEPAGQEGVANCTTDFRWATENRDTMDVTITGAYPGWRCTVDFTIRNWGNVPVVVEAPIISDVDWLALVSTCPTPVTLLNGQSQSCTLEISVDDVNALENSSVTFTGTIRARQWNLH